MQWIDRMRQVKILLVAMAVVMSVGSLVISHFLVRDLKREEQRKMEIWAEAMRSLNSADEYTDLTLVLTVLNSNSTIPVVVLDREGEVQDYRNIPMRDGSPQEQMREVRQKARSMAEAGRVIRVYLSSSDYMEICYADSLLLRRCAARPCLRVCRSGHLCLAQ